MRKVSAILRMQTPVIAMSDGWSKKFLNKQGIMAMGHLCNIWDPKLIDLQALDPLTDGVGDLIKGYDMIMTIVEKLGFDINELEEVIS